MKVKLYGLAGGEVGTGTIPDTRANSEMIRLEEGPRGGTRLFVLGHRDVGGLPVYVELVPSSVPEVILDPVGLCEVTGTKSCPECGGTGKVDQGNCAPSGVCELCNGSGKVTSVTTH